MTTIPSSSSADDFPSSSQSQQQDTISSSSSMTLQRHDSIASIMAIDTLLERKQRQQDDEESINSNNGHHQHSIIKSPAAAADDDSMIMNHPSSSSAAADLNHMGTEGHEDLDQDDDVLLDALELKMRQQRSRRRRHNNRKRKIMGGSRQQQQQHQQENNSIDAAATARSVSTGNQASTSLSTAGSKSEVILNVGPLEEVRDRKQQRHSASVSPPSGNGNHNTPTPTTPTTATKSGQDLLEEYLEKNSSHSWRPLSGSAAYSTAHHPAHPAAAGDLTPVKHSQNSHSSSSLGSHNNHHPNLNHPHSPIDTTIHHSSTTLHHPVTEIPISCTTPESLLTPSEIFDDAVSVNTSTTLGTDSLTLPSAENVSNGSHSHHHQHPVIRRRHSVSIVQRYRGALNDILMKTPEEKSHTELIEEANKMRSILNEQHKRLQHLEKSKKGLNDALRMWVNFARDKDQHLISTLKEGENKVNRLTRHVQHLREQRNRIEGKLAEEKQLSRKNTFISTSFDISRIRGNTTSYLCVNLYAPYDDKTIFYNKEYRRKLSKRIEKYLSLFKPIPPPNEMEQQNKLSSSSHSVLSDRDLDNFLLSQYAQLPEGQKKSIHEENNDLNFAVKGLMKKLKAHEEAYRLREKMFEQNKQRAQRTIQTLQKEYKLKMEQQKEVKELEYILQETRNATREMESKHVEEMDRLAEELKEARKEFDKARLRSNAMQERITYYKRLAESKPKLDLASAPSGDIAICFTDVESSTALWMEDSKSMQEAINLHNILLRNLISQHDGMEIKNEGDGSMITFPSTKQALAFALDMQLQLPQIEWPGGLFDSEYQNPSVAEVVDEETGTVLFRGLRVRIGIHYANCCPFIDEATQRVDYSGLAISKASRVSSLAKGGQVLLSNDAYLQVESILNHSFGIPIWTERKGTARLRGMESDPEILWLVLPKELSKREIPSKINVQFSKTEQYRLELRRLEKRYRKQSAQMTQMQTKSAQKCQKLEKTIAQLQAQIRTLRRIQPSSDGRSRKPKDRKKKKKRSTKQFADYPPPTLTASSSWTDDKLGPERRKALGQRVNQAIDRIDDLSNRSAQLAAEQEETLKRRQPPLKPVRTEPVHPKEQRRVHRTVVSGENIPLSDVIQGQRFPSTSPKSTETPRGEHALHSSRRKQSKTSSLSPHAAHAEEISSGRTHSDSGASSVRTMKEGTTHPHHSRTPSKMSTARYTNSTRSHSTHGYTAEEPSAERDETLDEHIPEEIATGDDTATLNNDDLDSNSSISSAEDYIPTSLYEDEQFEEQHTALEELDAILNTLSRSESLAEETIISANRDSMHVPPRKQQRDDLHGEDPTTGRTGNTSFRSAHSNGHTGRKSHLSTHSAAAGDELQHHYPATNSTKTTSTPSGDAVPLEGTHHTDTGPHLPPINSSTATSDTVGVKRISPTAASPHMGSQNPARSNALFLGQGSNNVHDSHWNHASSSVGGRKLNKLVQSAPPPDMETVFTQTVTLPTDFTDLLRMKDTIIHVKSLLQKYQADNVKLQKKLHISENRLNNARSQLSTLDSLHAFQDEISRRSLVVNQNAVLQHFTQNLQQQDRKKRISIQHPGLVKSHARQQQERKKRSANEMSPHEQQSPSHYNSGDARAKHQQQVLLQSPKRTTYNANDSPYSGTIPSPVAGNPVHRLSLISALNSMEPRYEDRSVPEQLPPEFIQIIRKAPSTANANARRPSGDVLAQIDGLSGSKRHRIVMPSG